ncbi:MAG: NAD(P)H-dependent oxidoreductase subunit E [Defluviitaleaceae bacterium]|nr:NAD(P)H-dependent oxidoreductase subunit E [Defluviitaleaceae bacterium]
MTKDLLCEGKIQKLEEIIENHKNTKGKLMPILHEAQKLFGCIPMEVQKKIADKTNIPLAEIYGVVTFYSHFSIEPKGDYIISVCMGTACYVKNAGKILEHISKEANVETGKTSEDGKFTLEATRCIGACGLAPVITVNEEVYGRLKGDLQEVKDIFAKYEVV